MAAAAALAFTAALLQAFNHSLFKSLLFIGDGAVLTGQRDIQSLGGLIHMMPQTAFTMLGGCLSISALPPFNGFVSGWLVFQAILLSPELPQWGLRLMVPAVGATLALGAALSAACFVRAYGIAFLGWPGSAAVTAAVETDGFSRAVTGAMLILCLLLGIIPRIGIDAIAPVTQLLVGQSIIPIAERRSSYNGLLVFVLITLSTPLLIEIIHRFASRGVRRRQTWDCGYPDPSPVTQYTADSFSRPIRCVPVAFHARARTDMPLPGDARPARLTVTMRDLPWDAIYVPTAEVIWFAAEKLNHLQFLTIRKYLSQVFMALVALLLTVALWQLITHLFVPATIGFPDCGGAA
jgi:hydrogenase-4 component B